MAGHDKKKYKVGMFGSNYINHCSLDNLSGQFYISKYYLSREFKKKYGKGISSYITDLRINRAKELLRFSKKNVNEIASMCGISDSNYFLKILKKAEGITPVEYHKKWQVLYPMLFS